MRPITERFNIFIFATRLFYRVYDELHDWYFIHFRPDEVAAGSARMREVGCTRGPVHGLCEPVPCPPEQTVQFDVSERPAEDDDLPRDVAAYEPTPTPGTVLREVVDTAYGGTDTVTLPLGLFLDLRHEVLAGTVLGILNRASDLVRGVTFASEHAPEVDRPVDDGCLKHGCALHLARNLNLNEVAL